MAQFHRLSGRPVGDSAKRAGNQLRMLTEDDLDHYMIWSG
jgi:hypothetical protein